MTEVDDANTTTIWTQNLFALQDMRLPILK